MNQIKCFFKSLFLLFFVVFSFNSFAQKNTTPIILYILVDQWRAQSAGYAGNKDVHTPALDRLASQSMNLTHAVSGMPVCSPHRASFLTGQYPLTHGVFMNYVLLIPTALRLGKYSKKMAIKRPIGANGMWTVTGGVPTFR